jgi:acyl-CoA oxidase
MIARLRVGIKVGFDRHTLPLLCSSSFNPITLHFKSMFPTHEVVKSKLFQLRSEGLPMHERATLAYKRAKAIAQAYGSVRLHIFCVYAYIVPTGLTARDLLQLSPRFWQLHTDPIWAVDGAAGTLCTLQYNCCAGTIAMHATGRSDLLSVLDKVLSFEIS